MGIVSVYELGSERTATFAEAGRTEYTRIFQVRTNDADDGPLTVSVAVDPTSGLTIPTVGQIYSTNNETDVTARVTRVVPRQHDGENGKLWHVSVEYSTTFANTVGDPLSEPTKIRYSATPFQRPIFADINGQAVMNSARKYFDPPVEIDDSRPVITMQRNEPVFNPAIAADFQDGVNNAAWLSYPAKAVKVAGISAESMSQNGVGYWQVTYEFHVRRDLWVPLKILDQGRVDINGRDILSNGTPTIEPWPLDGAGAFLSIGYALTAVTFKEFTVYKQVDFSILALP